MNFHPARAHRHSNLCLLLSETRATRLETGVHFKESRDEQAYKQGERFLAHPIRHVKNVYYKITKKEKAWQIN